MKHITTALCMLLLSSVCTAGPFGLHMGMKLEEVKKIASTEQRSMPFSYMARSLPIGHPDFDVYSLKATPVHGLCSFIALSRDAKDVRDLRNLYRKLRDALAGKYGNTLRKQYPAAIDIDELSDTDWAMLQQEFEEQREVAEEGGVLGPPLPGNYWRSEAGEPLPDDLSFVMIVPMLLQHADPSWSPPNLGSAGNVSIRYDFVNAEKCTQWIAEERNGAL